MIIKSKFVLMEHTNKLGIHYDIRFKLKNDKYASFAIVKGIPEENKKTLAIKTKIHNEDSALYTGKTKDGRITKLDSGICDILKYDNNHIVIKFYGDILKDVYHFVNFKQDQYILFKGKLK